MGGLQRFGPFVVCRSIGRGGMGEVFLARTPWEAQPLAAVKRLRPDVARVPTFRERFRHEAELARRLSHPNLVGTLDIGEVEGQVYVATELVLGKDTGFIADRLRLRSQGGPVAVAIRLLLDGLAGLAYVHGAQDEDGRPLNLVHRDVTPGNLLLGYDGRSRLADFGLAKSYLSEGSGLTKQGEILGTPHYLPPEVVRGERARPASDIYGLGAVAYRFLTGIAPFQGSTSEVLNKVLKERPRPLAELRPDLPAWLADQVESMLEPNLQIRPAKAEPLIDVILSEARQAQMLVPRAAVGRWLAQLFGPEHAEEMEEYERLVALSPEALAVPREGTQVLVPAHGSSATADPTPETPFRSEADFDDRPGGALDATTDEDGTELELSASRVLGISPPLEAFEEDLVPTRAVEVPSSGFDFDTDLEGPAGEERRHGFVDHVDVDAAEHDTLQGTDGAVALRGPAASNPPTSDGLLVTPVEEALPRAVTDDGRSRRGATPRRQRPILLLVGLLGFAVAAGIGLGKIMTRVRRGTVSAAPVRPLRGRLHQLEQRLEDRRAEGRRVPRAAWRHLAGAASALLDGEDGAARAHLEAAERSLER